jgi:ligand-binding sensor domain-containing protein
MNKKIVISIVFLLGLGLFINVYKRPKTKRVLGDVICPENDICTMVLDGDRGWVGGRDGVFEIDIPSLKIRRNIGEGITLDYVRHLAIDDKKQLWIATIHGLWIYKNGELKKPFNGKFNNKRINAVFFDTQHNLWIGCWAGAYCYDGEMWTHYTTKDGLADNMVNLIFQTDDGDIILGSYVSPHGGLSILNKNSKKWYKITTDDSLVHADITSIVETDGHHLWVGSGLFNSGGVSLLRKNSRGVWGVFQVMGQKDGISGKKIRSLFIDKQKGIWLGTEYDGVNLIKKNKVCRIFNTKSGLCHDEVKCIREDTQGRLWFGTKSGITIYTP